MMTFHSAGLNVTVCLEKLKYNVMINYPAKLSVYMFMYLNVRTSGIILGRASSRLRLS